MTCTISCDQENLLKMNMMKIRMTGKKISPCMVSVTMIDKVPPIQIRLIATARVMTTITMKVGHCQPNSSNFSGSPR